jgi:hypothetical protein
MNRCCVFGLAFLVVVGAVRAADPAFWQQLTPEERRAAGVERLTPEQRAALDALAARFAREGARQGGEQTTAEVRESVKQEVREEAKKEAREEARREVQAEEKSKQRAQMGLPNAEERETIVSRIRGRFNGWGGHTIFTLENGQVWVQSNSTDSLWVPTREDPEVEIRPVSIGGWRLFLRGTGFWLRVRRVK